MAEVGATKNPSKRQNGDEEADCSRAIGRLDTPVRPPVQTDDTGCDKNEQLNAERGRIPLCEGVETIP
jgi:hypothetical protein